MKKVCLAIVFFLAFFLRLYRIDAPLADWHSWRQADTAAVSRNFLKRGFDVFRPRFDDLSNVASGEDNPQGYRFVEFPIYNVIHAGLAKTFPQKSLEWWGRMVSIIFSLGSILLLYLICEKYLGWKVGILASFFFAVLPFNIFYSRTILPEPMMIFISLSSLYFFDRWLEDKRFSFVFYLLSGLLAAISLLLKPFAMFLFFPMVYLVWRKWQVKSFKKLSLYCYAFIALLPFGLWRVWMQQFPEGIPAFTWLFNEGKIRFKGAFFYWIFAERIGRLILGYWGLVFLALGLVVKTAKKEGFLFYSWLLSVLFYFTVIAGGNVRHDYYQILAIPIICIFLGKGFYLLLNPKPVFNKLFARGLSIVVLLFMLAFSWYYVRDFFNINNPAIVEAGKAVDKLIPKEAKVIAPYGGDTSFLYQTNRRGWPVGIEIEKMIAKGANFYVNVNFGPETQWVSKNYCLLKKTSDFVIVDLNKKCQP